MQNSPRKVKRPAKTDFLHGPTPDQGQTHHPGDAGPRSEQQRPASAPVAAEPHQARDREDGAQSYEQHPRAVRKVEKEGLKGRYSNRHVKIRL